MPLVRVVLPTYNRAELVAEALRSVQAQGLQDYEVVVADDGSTDGTVKVLKRAMAGDSRIRCVSLVHGGSARARNAAVTVPGEYKYAAFLDSDDLWTPDHLEAAVRLLEMDPSLALVFGRIETIDLSGSWTDAELRLRENRIRRAIERARPTAVEGVYLLDAPAAWEAMLRNEFVPAVPTVVVRRSAVDRTEWFDPALEIYEDCELFLHLARHGRRFAFLDTVQARVRQAGDNLTGIGPTLASPALLRRYQSVLRYSRLKLNMCSNATERAIARRQAAEAAYVAGQCCCEQNAIESARGYYLEALRHRASWASLKGYLAACLPSGMASALRRVRGART